MQLAITGDAGVRAPFVDGVELRVMAWSVTNGPETFPVSEPYSLPMNAKSLVGLVMANLCGRQYPLHMAMVGASSQSDKAFSITKCVLLARMSHHSHRLFKKILGALPGDQRENLSEMWGRNS